MNADNTDLKRATTKSCSTVLLLLVPIRADPRLFAANAWWSELELNQPFGLFRPALIRLSYPTEDIAPLGDASNL